MLFWFAWLFGKLFDHSRHVFCVLEIQIHADVFVGGVGFCIGVAESHRRNGQAQVMDERVTGSRSADHRDNFHRHAIDFCRSFHNDFYKRVIGVGARGGFAAEEGDLHIAEALRVEMGAQFLENVRQAFELARGGNPLWQKRARAARSLSQDPDSRW